MGAPDTVSKRLLTGAAAGAIATGAMTTVLFAAKRVVTSRRVPAVGPVGDAEAAPPETPPERLTPGQRALALATHVGIGCAAGVTFALSRERIIPDRLPGAAAGAMHGLAVWAIGYLGVLPKLDVLPPAYRDDRRRAAAVLAAHLAYGATVGTLVDVALHHRARRR